MILLSRPSPYMGWTQHPPNHIRFLTFGGIFKCQVNFLGPIAFNLVSQRSLVAEYWDVDMIYMYVTSENTRALPGLMQLKGIESIWLTTSVYYPLIFSNSLLLQARILMECFCCKGWMAQLSLFAWNARRRLSRCLQIEDNHHLQKANLKWIDVSTVDFLFFLKEAMDIKKW